MSLLVTFQENTDKLSSLKFCAEYIVNKTYLAFLEDFGASSDEKALTESSFKKYLDSLSNRCEIILLNFGYINLDNVSLSNSTKNILEGFLELFKIHSDPKKYKNFELLSMVIYLDSALESFCEKLSKCISNFPFDPSF